jgi:hypothetical protein
MEAPAVAEELAFPRSFQRSLSGSSAGSEQGGLAPLQRRAEAAEAKAALAAANAEAACLAAALREQRSATAAAAAAAAAGAEAAEAQLQHFSEQQRCTVEAVAASLSSAVAALSGTLGAAGQSLLMGQSALYEVAGRAADAAAAGAASSSSSSSFSAARAAPLPSPLRSPPAAERSSPGLSPATDRAGRTSSAPLPAGAAAAAAAAAEAEATLRTASRSIRGILDSRLEPWGAQSSSSSRAAQRQQQQAHSHYSRQQWGQARPASGSLSTISPLSLRRLHAGLSASASAQGSAGHRAHCGQDACCAVKQLRSVAAVAAAAGDALGGGGGGSPLGQSHTRSTVSRGQPAAATSGSIAHAIGAMEDALAALAQSLKTSA